MARQTFHSMLGASFMAACPTYWADIVTRDVPTQGGPAMSSSAPLVSHASGRSARLRDLAEARRSDDANERAPEAATRTSAGAWRDTRQVSLLWHLGVMPTHESAVQRGARRARDLLRRVGDELRLSRVAAGLSTRTLGRMVGISHTQVIRIEGGHAPHVDIDVVSRMASVLGYSLTLGIYQIATPVRDAGHLALLARLRERVHASVRWRSEVPMPIPGDLRSADATLDGDQLDAMIEAETRLADVQGLERRVANKARDLGVRRVILLVLDSSHNREVVRSTPWLAERFPVGTRAALAALRHGRDPGGDCLVFL